MVATHNEKLSSLDDLFAGGPQVACQALQEIVSSVPKLVVSIGQALSKAFASKAQKQVHEVANLMVGPSANVNSDLGVEDTEALTSLLATAASVYTQDTHFLELQQNAMAHHTRLSKGAKTFALVKLIEGFVSDGEIGDRASELQTALSSVGQAALPDEATTGAASVVTMLVSEFVNNVVEPRSDHLTLAKELGTHLDSQVQPFAYKLVEPLQHCVACFAEKDRVVAAGTPEGGVFDAQFFASGNEFGKIEVLLVAYQRAKEAIAEVNFTEENNLKGFEAINKAMGDCWGLLQVIGQVTMESAEVTFDNVLAEIKKYQGGLEDGDWLEKLPTAAEKNFKLFLAHAKRTLLKCNKVALMKSKVEECEQAVSYQLHDN